MKINGKGVQLCTCGRLDKGRKSFFSSFDIKLGIILVIVGTIALIILMKTLVAPLMLYGLIGMIWLTFFLIWLAKKHTLKCAARWAGIVALGTLGGGILGF